MGYSILETILQNLDFDIVEAFRSLSSPDAKIQAMEQVAKGYGQLRSHLTQHRCLLVLARLLEEWTKPALPDAVATSASLFQQWLTSSLIPGSFHNLPTMSPPDQIAYLTSELRKQAAIHLRSAIIEACPIPERALTNPKGMTWSLRNTCSHTLAPVRLDLGMGGISDIPPYSLERYGNCVNVPIRVNGDFPLEARLEKLNQPLVHFVSRDLGVEKTYHDFSEFDDQTKGLLFHKEAIRFFVNHPLGLNSLEEFYASTGGGLRLETCSRLPVGTGLGVSSLLLSGIIKVLSSLFDILITPQMLLGMSVYLENVTGIGGGWEDATAIFSGVKLVESFPDAPLSPLASWLSLRDPDIRKLQEHVVLIYTGIPKQGSAYFDAMVEKYCLREANTLRAIERNNILNRELRTILLEGDIAGIGQIFQSQWENWKQLSEGKCTNSQIDRLFTEVAPYVYGSRMNGAGQGGCAMFVAKEGNQDKLTQVIRTILGNSAVFYRWDPVI